MYWYYVSQRFYDPLISTGCKGLSIQNFTRHLDLIAAACCSAGSQPDISQKALQFQHEHWLSEMSQRRLSCSGRSQAWCRKEDFNVTSADCCVFSRFFKKQLQRLYLHLPRLIGATWPFALDLLRLAVCPQQSSKPATPESLLGASFRLPPPESYFLLRTFILGRFGTQIEDLPAQSSRCSLINVL